MAESEKKAPDKKAPDKKDKEKGKGKVDEKAEEGGPAKAGDKKKRRLSFKQYLLIVCGIGLVIGLSVIGIIVVPELNKKKGQPTAEELAAAAAQQKSAAEAALAAEKERIAAEAEAKATWQNFHCNLMARYYKGQESTPPLAELIGISRNANEVAIHERCEELLPSVKMMGGWPNDQTAQDNFVVCVGFELILKGSMAFVIRPTREDLARGHVGYGQGAGENLKTQEVFKDHTVKLESFTPLVLQADDRCVIVASWRTGRKRAIAGMLRRVNLLAMPSLQDLEKD